MIKEKKYLKDTVAGIIFSDETCREYVEKVVSSALGIDESIIKNNLVLSTPRINASVKTKYSMADVILENNTSIINIEINYVDTETGQVKNLRYVCNLILRQIPIGMEDKIKSIYQININNYDIFKKDKFIYRSYLMEEKLHIKRDDFITIIDINVDFLNNIDYNNIKEDKDSLEYLLYIFVNDNKEELDKLYLDDIIMEKVRDKLHVLHAEDLEDLYYDHEEFRKKCSYELGLKEGKEEGKQTEKIEIAKKLLNLNVSIDNIIGATGLTKEEIESLKTASDK